MTRVLLAITVLALCVLACGQQVATVTPEPTPTPSPTAPATLSPTVPPTASATEAEQDTAIVLPAVLVVRQADGAATDKYLQSGDEVILTGECVDKWCPIRSGDISGWVYQGCLSEVAGDLRCEARP